MANIHIIGVAENLAELGNFPPQFWQKTALIIATSRYKELMDQELIAGKFKAISPLSEAIKAAQEAHGPVVIVASGDPLFYGIGNTLLKHFRAEELNFHPSLSSIQKACALCKTAWHDAQILSLHGRQHPHIAGKILPHHKSIILTDSCNNPQAIAKGILHYLEVIEAMEMAGNIRLAVAENLGAEHECLHYLNLVEASQKEYAPLNVLIIFNDNRMAALSPFGLREDDIYHSRGLITKNEVRAASIHALNLPAQGIMWDVGAGSGSVSIEAARINPELTIYAIEQRPEEIANIKANIKKFSCYNIIPLHGRAEDFLDDLPQPERIFVGGSGGALEIITAKAKEVLPENGRLVVNSVLPKTADEAPRFMRAQQMEVYSSCIRVSRSTPEHIEFNPITIIIGCI